MTDYQTDMEMADNQYSRRDRKKGWFNKKKAAKDTPAEVVEPPRVVLDKIKLPAGHYALYLLFSLVIGAVSVVLPYLSDWATSQQVQHLYVGTMMGQGTMPYSDIFATGGFLYYTIMALLTRYGLSFGLIGVQAFFLFLSGIAFERVFMRLTRMPDMGLGMTGVFYLLNLALGFGGLYPIQWAMPFLLWGLDTLVAYFNDENQDESFISYGLMAVLALLFEPITILFWLLALAVLTVYNISQKRWARGFYQFLCLAFGGLVVLYVALYFMINFQILVPYVKQTLIYPILSFAREGNDWLQSLGLQLGGVLAAGLLLGFLQFPILVGRKQGHKTAKWLIFLSGLTYLVYALLSQSMNFYPLLLVLPFGLLLMGLVLAKHQAGDLYPQAFTPFLKSHLFVPVLFILGAVAYPIAMGIMASSVNQERDLVATYLTKHSQPEEKIVVWDDNSRIYLKANCQSASQLSTPALDTVYPDNHHLLEDELLQHEAAYLVVNTATKAMPEQLQADLEKHYQQVTVEGLEQFRIYQKQ